MNKAFKRICVFLSVCLVLASVSMLFAVGSTAKNGFSLNVYGSDDIVANIKNLEMNMTSVIYLKNSEGNWEEYQRVHGNENRIWVSIDKMPKQLQEAFIAIEDQRFYQHDGVDWKSTVLAFANQYLKFYSSKRGGSTITQQLVKNITDDKERTSDRKIREIFRALALEQTLDKTTILEAYLNTISLGNGICGVQVAANYYFNKDVSELTLVECAAIAAITKNPTAYNPVSKPEGNRERRNVVLDKMAELGKISQEEAEAAKQQDIVLDDSQRSSLELEINNYFVDALIANVIDDLSEKYGCSESVASTMFYNGGYKIYATMDPAVQEQMEKVYLNTKQYFSQKATTKNHKGESAQSAMTVMDYQGHIIGIVGGVGKKTTNRGLNRATDSPRQPGSTMKPLGAYTPALENGVITPVSTEVDSPLPNYYGNGKAGPKEWYGYYAGRMTIASALERSANTIPCKIVKEMGTDISYDFLTKQLNLKHLVEGDKNISALALGGCHYGITTTESAAAYAMFGNGGKYFKPTTYYTVERVNGEVVLAADTDGKQVIHPGTARVMNEMLQRVVYGGRGTGKKISSFSSMKAYAKTGTSSECNDLWMVAGSPYYIGSVWYGFDQPEEIKNTSAAANVWLAVMKEVHKGLEKKEFDLSAELEKREYCRSTGKLAGENCKSKGTAEFIPGVELSVCDGKHSNYVAPSSSETPSSSSSETPSSSPSVPSSPSEASSSPSSSVPSEPSGSSSGTSSSVSSSDGSSDTSGSSETSHE